MLTAVMIWGRDLLQLLFNKQATGQSQHLNSFGAPHPTTRPSSKCNARIYRVLHLISPCRKESIKLGRPTVYQEGTFNHLSHSLLNLSLLRLRLLLLQSCWFKKHLVPKSFYAPRVTGTATQQNLLW